MKNVFPSPHLRQREILYPPMPTRRAFLRHPLTTTCGLLSASALSRALGEPAIEEKLEAFKGADVFDRILGRALDGKWSALSIGEAMGRIAKEFEGTPYVGFTLELSRD